MNTYTVTCDLTDGQQERLERIAKKLSDFLGREATAEETFRTMMYWGSEYEITLQMNSFEGFLDRDNKEEET